MNRTVAVTSVEVKLLLKLPSATWFSQAHGTGIGGADPLVRGRRPRRPTGTVQDVGIVEPAAGRGRPGPEGTPTSGSAPPLRAQRPLSTRGLSQPRRNRQQIVGRPPAEA